MERPGKVSERVIQVLCGFSFVDHAQYLFAKREVLYQLVLCDGSDVSILYPLENPVFGQFCGTEFGNCPVRVKFFEYGVKRGLCSRAQHGGAFVVFDQLVDGIDARPDVFQRKELRFVKDDDAVCNIVQFPASSGLAGIERFEELY